jgi:hypothetical protein
VRMLGRYQRPGCCPGTRDGRGPGPDCSGGGPEGTRAAKRAEARMVEAELAPDADDREWMATLGPLYDASDCVHGCSGSPSCTGERCTFVCHENYRAGDSG